MKYFDFEEMINETLKRSKHEGYRIGARNIAVNQELPKAVEKAGFLLLKPGTAFDLSGLQEAIIIGVELWSPLDLYGLDLLANSRSDKGVPVYVFDLDEFYAAGELDRVIPGINPKQTPVLVEYSHGRVALALEGQDALTRMNRTD